MNIFDVGRFEKMIITESNQSSLEITGTDIRSVILPSKMNSVGRPKGSKTTVIGVKRKREVELNISGVAKKQFIQKSDDDQALTILEWLTKKERSEILKGIVSVADIIDDSMILNRLRNSEIYTLNI